MKVNPLGIQSYQSVNRQDRPPASPLSTGTDARGDQKVVIEPQSTLQKSALSVKVPQGTYANYLSSAERQALDMLFDKFRDTSRFSATAGGTETDSGEQSLGRVVDVKV
jgi:hypothetical protein